MTHVTIIGSQWGDEGKGKIVDWLAAEADVVVRFQGGHNAGHTLVVDGVTYKLSLLPSGVVRGKLSIIGSGVVVNPWALLDEMATLAEQGVDITPDTLQIAENAPLILPLHAQQDLAKEEARGHTKIGTTGRGIGPAYEDKVARRGLRACDLLSLSTLMPKIAAVASHYNALRSGHNLPPIDEMELLQSLQEIAPKITPFLAPTWRTLHAAGVAGRRILFEGAQGTLLDIDHGTYPFVTSSNTTAGQAITGSGSGQFGRESYMLGITKAYTTRVGSGPFPTELNDDTGQHLGEKGHEFGTVTGRQRRCGWFDAVLVRQAAIINGLDGLSLTKLDVLDELEEINICTHYEIDGQRYDYLPALPEAQTKVKPVYKTLPGWQATTHGVQHWDDLPAAAQEYVKQIQQLTDVPVAMVSTSPKREDTILIQDPFAKVA